MLNKPNFRQLRAIAKVSELGRVSSAARELNVSQPSITRMIKSLEKDLDVSLFERSSDGMIPTECGTVLAVRVERAMSQLRLAEHELAVANGNLARSLYSRRISQFANYQELNAVIEVGKFQNVTAAAAKLGISQPAVNRSLRNLEKRLELNLFDRRVHGMILNQSGQIVIKRIKIAYSEIRHALEEIANLKGLDVGAVNIGVLPLSRVLLVPLAVERLLSHRANVKVSILGGLYQSQLNLLGCGDIDLIVGTIREPINKSEISAEKLMDENMIIVARKGHELFDRDDLTSSSLQNEKWVLPHKGVPIRTQFEDALREQNIPLPENVVETDSLVVARSFLLEGERLAVLSTSQIYHDELFGLLKPLPIQLQTPSRPVGIITRDDFLPAPTTKLLLKFLREIAGEIAPLKTGPASAQIRQ